MKKVMINLKQEKNKYIFSAAGIIIFILFIFFVVKPLRGKVTRIQAEIKVAEREVIKGLKVKAQRDVIDQDYQNYSKYIGQIDISDQQILGDFMKEVEDICRRAYITVVDLNPSNVAQENGYKVCRAHLKAEGGITSLLSFLNEVYKSNLLIKSERFKISNKSKDPGILLLETRIVRVIP